jgi:hypothetical protein
MINTKKFDDYQMKEYNNKQDLMADLKKAGVSSQSLWIEEGDNGRADFRVIMNTEKAQMLVNRDYHGHVSVSVYPYRRYDRVDSYKAGEIRKAVYTSNNMKAITSKKLAEKIAEEILFHEKMDALNNANADKVAQFLAMLEASGEVIRYTYRDYYTDAPKQINGGYIERNGLEYSFEIGDGGYISQKIRTDYRANTTLETFQALADNKYQHND